MNKKISSLEFVNNLSLVTTQKHFIELNTEEEKLQIEFTNYLFKSRKGQTLSPEVIKQIYKEFCYCIETNNLREE